MANEILPSREVIFQEDTAYRRSVSEVILAKFGAQSNFLNTFQNDSHRFNLNGFFSIATGLDFYDGPQLLFTETEIVALSFWQEAGTSGTTDFDIRWGTQANSDQGSIFSTTPKISGAGKKVVFQNFVTGNDFQPSNTTLGVLSKNTFSEGNFVYLRLNSAMTEAFNGGLNIFYRPINAGA